MTGDDQSDPFLWDEDRVVRELCTENRSWEAPPSDRLPDPATFEVKLRERGVDGAALLTYADEFSLNELLKLLEVTKLPHRSSLKHAITRLQARSPGYRKWIAQHQANSQRHDGGEHGSVSVEPEPYR